MSKGINKGCSPKKSNLFYEGCAAPYLLIYSFSPLLRKIPTYLIITFRMCRLGTPIRNTSFFLLYSLLLYLGSSMYLPNPLIAQPIDRCVHATSFFDQERANQLEAYTKNWLANPPAKSRSKITIPVVVHIVWNKEVHNISDEQIHSQINALNRDFQLQNENLEIIPNVFDNIVGNVGFEFCLASFDELGNPTNGITRTETSFSNVGAKIADPLIYYTEKGGKDAWDTQKYLNIWVAEIPNVLGYASRPGENLPAEDGVVVNPDYFGTVGTAKSPYHLGRTTTHEIGHYFNLSHLDGGNGLGCEEEDGVEDTPNQMSNYTGCPDETTFSCGSLDLIANYMNWVDDACMALFTKGQVERMHAALNGARAGLLANTNCLSTSTKKMDKAPQMMLYPNPTTDYVNIQLASIPATVNYQVFNTRGHLVKEGVLPNKQTTQISLPFPKGIYWITIATPKGILTKKLLLL